MIVCFFTQSDCLSTFKNLANLIMGWIFNKSIFEWFWNKILKCNETNAIIHHKLQTFKLTIIIIFQSVKTLFIYKFITTLCILLILKIIKTQLQLQSHLNTFPLISIQQSFQDTLYISNSIYPFKKLTLHAYIQNKG